MPPSQLKRLKASLRDQGIVGPQQSKKQKRQEVQNGANQQKRVRKAAALTGIREQFNPFEYKGPARAPKFDVTTNQTMTGRVSKGIKSRPGLVKGAGEESRRRTLLKEIHTRNKVGGIIDRRFGEDDPTMTPEERMLERFAREKQKRHRNAAFDLEDDEDGFGLTHMGKSLSLDQPTIVDDFAESDAGQGSSDTDGSTSRKRRREFLEELHKEEEERAEAPERKKSKQEVMQEVIAKSKLHKYERQAAKEDDEDLREELDQELQGIQEILRGQKSGASNGITDSGKDPGRVARLDGPDKAKMEKDYDVRLKQMALDARSKPTERTKTDAEIAQAQSEKLQELEQQRLRRMHGVGEDDEADDLPPEEAELSMKDASDDFGLGQGLQTKRSSNHVLFEDEDDFLMDDDLIASEQSSGSDSGSSDEADSEEEEDPEDVTRLLTIDENLDPEVQGITDSDAGENTMSNEIPFTFPCPQSLGELLEVLQKVPLSGVPTAIQRIRALYHPKLKSEYKILLGTFAAVLVEYVAAMGATSQLTREILQAAEQVIRHIHSLAKMFPMEVAEACRSLLQNIHEQRPTALTTGDLLLLTAIGSIFPTSDHFHQVVTPAMLTMTRYLSQKIPHRYSDHAINAYLCTLCIQYQAFAKRYIPEVMSSIGNALAGLSPEPMDSATLPFPVHVSPISMRITEAAGQVSRLGLKDCSTFMAQNNAGPDATRKTALLSRMLELLDAATDLWNGQVALSDVLEPFQRLLGHYLSPPCRACLCPGVVTSITRLHQKLTHVLNLARLARRPLELHHHRPLAIKMHVPRFEESFDPSKHYDPNRERAEAAKLRAQHKKERKGAMRELRRDAQFVARESLREKRERDAAYERKMKRLVAEIQGEEGMEAKKYAKEKEERQRLNRRGR